MGTPGLRKAERQDHHNKHYDEYYNLHAAENAKVEKFGSCQHADIADQQRDDLFQTG